MFGLKLLRGDLQAELVRQVHAAGLAHTIDANGFIVVADDDTGALEEPAFDIASPAVGAQRRRDVWHFSSEAEPRRNEKRSECRSRGVPFVEYDTFSDRVVAPELPGRGRPLRVRHRYALLIRHDASLPKGQRPWDRE